MTVANLAANLATDAIVRTSTGEAVTFWLLGAVAVAGAIGVVLAVNAVYSAMFLAMTMISLAVFYMIEDAVFLGVVQVVVYTGAVMMLFLFVLMLIGVDSAESLKETLRGQRVAAVITGIGFGILLIAAIGSRGDREFRRADQRQLQWQRRGLGGADLLPLPVGLRVDQRAADHRGRRGDGAGASGTLRAPQDTTRAVRGTLPSRRSPDPDAQPGRLRTPQRGRRGGDSARRVLLAAVGVADPAQPWIRR